MMNFKKPSQDSARTRNNALLVAFHPDALERAFSPASDTVAPSALQWLLSRESYGQVVLLSAVPEPGETSLGPVRTLLAAPSHLRVIKVDTENLLGGLAEFLAHEALPSDCREIHVLPGEAFQNWDELLSLAAPDSERSILLVRVRPPRFPDDPAATIRREGLSSGGGSVVREARAAYGSGPAAESVARQDTDSLLAEAAEQGIVGRHPALVEALERCRAVRDHDVPVLILGPTGSGKELFAGFIHRTGARAAGPFITVNCAALPEHLVESTLFGHCRGAFTGANRDYTGRFADADGGTLFLDEVGELPLELQSKLLRVLEDGMVQPLGGSSAEHVNVRVVAATHRDLAKDICDGRFREDLFHRLNFAQVQLPALTARREDIPLLALHFLDRFNLQMKEPVQLSPCALQHLAGQSWPGGVRQLQNVLGRTALFNQGAVIEERDLWLDDATRSVPEGMPVLKEGFSLEAYLDHQRRALIGQALEASEGNQSGAARLLGISPQAVHKFLKKERA